MSKFGFADSLTGLGEIFLKYGGICCLALERAKNKSFLLTEVLCLDRRINDSWLKQFYSDFNAYWRLHCRFRRNCPFFGKVKHCGCQRVAGELTSGWTINVDDAGNKSWRWLFEASMVIDLLPLWMVGGELIDIRLVASGLMVPASRIWCGLWEWLQFCPWNMRFGAAVCPFAGFCA